MYKKILAGLTAFVMVFGIGGTFGVVDKDVFTLSASAEGEKPTSGVCGKNLSWKIEDKVLTISGKGEMEKTSTFSTWAVSGKVQTICSPSMTAN